MKTSVSIARKKQKGGQVTRTSRRLQRRCCLRREYKKLRSLLPRTVKPTDLRHKVGVVDAAYQYIRQLQSALLDKFSSRGIPPDLANIVGNKVTSAEDVQALALYLIRQNSNSLSNGSTNDTNDLVVTSLNDASNGSSTESNTLLVNTPNQDNNDSNICNNNNNSKTKGNSVCNDSRSNDSNSNNTDTNSNSNSNDTKSTVSTNNKGHSKAVTEGDVTTTDVKSKSKDSSEEVESSAQDQSL